MKPGPGVIINGIQHQTIIDDQGVQRFRQNKIIRDLLDNSTSAGPESKPFPGYPRAQKLGLNEVAIRVGNGTYTENDKRELYRLIGYSICGYAEIFEDDIIENPLWDKDKS